MATQWKYMPVLKWKQGERIALKNLTAAQAHELIPLIELLPISAAPDTASLRAALPEYLAKVGKELETSLPEGIPLVIDARYVAPTYTPQARLLRVICARLQSLTRRPVVPVISQGMLQEVPNELHKLGEFGEQLVRILAPFTSVGAVAEIVKLCVAAKLPRKSLHLLIDQFSMVGEAPASKWKSVQPYLDAALASGCGSTTLAGGSFPINLIGIKQGIHDIPRVEWQVWTLLRKDANYNEVRYSDYTVSNPALAPEVDPKQVNPSVAIRYAADGHWRLFKAGGFKNGQPGQYKSLCKLLLGDSVYSGAAFSYGDTQYEKAATDPKAGSGNPSSWRRDATSHHLVKVAGAL